MPDRRLKSSARWAAGRNVESTQERLADIRNDLADLTRQAAPERHMRASQYQALRALVEECNKALHELRQAMTILSPEKAVPEEQTDG